VVKIVLKKYQALECDKINTVRAEVIRNYISRIVLTLSSSRTDQF